MDKILQIVKETLFSLKEKNTTATPIAYANEFYSNAKRINPNSKILNDFNKFYKTLSSDEKKELEKNKVNTYYNIAKTLKNRVSNNDVSRFVNHMPYIMSASISTDVEEDIDSILKDLANNPDKLTNEVMIKKLSNITEKRISSDRTMMEEKTEDVKKILSLMSKYFDKSLVQSHNTKDEVKSIKSDLKELELSKYSQRDLNNLYIKLTTTIQHLETSVEKNEIELIKGKEENEALVLRVKKLEEDLNKVKKENEIDFLTKILNRRAFNSELRKFEKKYKTFESTYAIVFYDIDHFKDINDTYGHDCGDHILQKFANVLNKLTRVEDCIARYGGEEFVALINYKSEEEVKNYLRRVRDVINSNKFPYKNIKIKLRFSAGAVLRKDFYSYEDAVIKADDNLYEAKNSGRNKVLLSGNVLI